MNGKGQGRRRSLAYLPGGESLEGRRLLTVISLSKVISPLEANPIAQPARPPNTPVMPFATPTKKATFIDPTVTIDNGNSVVISYQSYIAPYAKLDGSRGGAIKVGIGSTVLDNARLIANPNHAYKAPQLLVGNSVAIGPGALVIGPSVIGSYADNAAPTSIGARAVIDDAIVQPGAIISPLARVGPGVTVPTGYRVLPGANVTNNAEASNPQLGMVVPVTSSDVAAIKMLLTDAQGLAAGYTRLYQGNSATGPNLGGNPAIGGVYNGYLPNVEGASPSPGPSYVGGTKSLAPAFQTPKFGPIGAVLYNYPGRVIGDVTFDQRAWQVATHLGRANSIRADVGQPIVIGSIAKTGPYVTITSPVGGAMAIGQDFRAGGGAVLMGSPGVDMVLGDDVSIGSHAVVQASSLGSGTTVGAGAYLLNSTFPAGSVIPAGAIYINNKFEGSVQS